LFQYLSVPVQGPGRLIFRDTSFKEVLFDAVPFEVVRVEGRYPYQDMRACRFHSKNITASVSLRNDGTAVIRLGDEEYQDMWMHIEVRGSIAGLLHELHIPHSDDVAGEDER